MSRKLIKRWQKRQQAANAEVYAALKTIHDKSGCLRTLDVAHKAVQAISGLLLDSEKEHLEYMLRAVHVPHRMSGRPEDHDELVPKVLSDIWKRVAGEGAVLDFRQKRKQRTANRSPARRGNKRLLSRTAITRNEIATFKIMQSVIRRDNDAAAQLPHLRTVLSPEEYRYVEDYVKNGPRVLVKPRYAQTRRKADSYSIYELVCELAGEGNTSEAVVSRLFFHVRSRKRWD